jgi:hypothetical protein
MPDYFLYPKAVTDVEEIYLAGLTQSGAPQGQRYQRELHGRFQLPGEFPGMAGARLCGLSRCAGRVAPLPTCADMANAIMLKHIYMQMKGSPSLCAGAKTHKMTGS